MWPKCDWEVWRGVGVTLSCVVSIMLTLLWLFLLLGVAQSLTTTSQTLYASAGSNYQLYVEGEFPLVVGKSTTVYFGLKALWWVVLICTLHVCINVSGRSPSDVLRIYDLTFSLTNGGNYYSQGSPVVGQTSCSFTPQQGKVIIGVTFKEDKSWATDPTTSNSVEFDLLQGGADAYWRGFSYYPFFSGGCAGATLATGRIWGIGKSLVLLACMYFAHLWCSCNWLW